MAHKAITDPIRDKLILVIDNDARVLDAMRGLLRSWGCRVVTAESDNSVLASLAATALPPDLIISDFRLSDGKTGIEIIERLRSAFSAPIPAFLVTGDIAPERLREARAMDLHLLHKPVGPMALRAMLNQLLRGSGAAGDPLQATMARGSATSRQPAADPNPAHPLQ